MKVSKDVTPGRAPHDGFGGLLGASRESVLRTTPPLSLPPLSLPLLSLPLLSLAIRREAARLCAALGWAVLHEVPIPNGRRCDLLALRPDGGFVCIEVKSGVRDFLTDGKWPEYRAYCDALYFAVGDEFPAGLIPDEVGLIVACISAPGEPAVVRDAPAHPLAPARRRALLMQFATLAANRLAMVEDPAATAAFRAALRVE